tara:strand:+ start:54608 stop:55042 length:435 start_codon:yes stop_codon:yes gene_type:complete
MTAARTLFVLACCAALSLTVQAESPKPIHPDQAAWSAPLGLGGVGGAWLLGSQEDEGIYQYRVRLEPGARIPPHIHPDTRNSTVLKGTLWVGFGESFDEDAMVAVPEGGLYLAPAGTPHYLWARDGAVEYQENGVGPSGTRVLQ